MSAPTAPTAYLDPTLILGGVRDLLAALPMPAPYDALGNAFTEVRLYAHENLVQAMRDLLIFEDRVALIVPTGLDHENKTEGRVLTSRETLDFVLIVADRVYGDFEAAALSGAADDTNPGLLRLQHWMKAALVGQSLGLPYVCLQPDNGQVLRLSDTDRKSQKGREAWAQTFTTPVGEMRVDRRRPGVTSIPPAGVSGTFNATVPDNAIAALSDEFAPKTAEHFVYLAANALLSQPGLLPGTWNPAALVPDNAPIQPPQAFVPAMLQIAANHTADGNRLEAANCGITSIDLSAFDSAGHGFGSVILTGNALTTQGVDAVLARLVNHPGDYSSGGFLSLYGPNMGSPTPARTGATPGVFRITITGQPGDLSSVSLFSQAGAYGVTFRFSTQDPAVDGHPTGLTNATVWINTYGASPVEIATLIRDNLPSSWGWSEIGWQVESAGNVVTITPQSADQGTLDVSFQDRAVGPNVTVTVDDFAPNADLRTLIAAGWHGDYKGTDGSQVTF